MRACLWLFSHAVNEMLTIEGEKPIRPITRLETLNQACCVQLCKFCLVNRNRLPPGGLEVFQAVYGSTPKRRIVQNVLRIVFATYDYCIVL